MLPVDSVFQLHPLSETEKIFKDLYHEHKALVSSTALSLKELFRSVPQYEELLAPDGKDFSAQDYLRESLFPQFLDVAILPHERYTPPFLHSHSFFELIYVVKGSCRNQIGSKNIFMEAGDICIIAPGKTHAIFSFDDDALIYNLMVRSGTFEHTFLNALPHKDILSTFFSKVVHAQNPDAYILFRTGEDLIQQGLLKKMLKEYTEHRHYYNTILNALITLFFLKLLQNHEKDVIVPNPETNEMDENIIFILNYMTEHYNTITLNGLADFFITAGGRSPDFSKIILDRIL